METRYDIKIEKTFVNTNNDIEWFASDIIHIEDTIQTTPGSYKENPEDGVAVANYLSSSGQEAIVGRKVILELQKDLYQCDSPIVTYDSSGKLTINPNINI
jgi:hypothetical protein